MTQHHEPFVRGYVPSDLPAMYDICLRTGDAGGDATALFDDRFVGGHVYCGPYPTHDPGLCFVAVDELGVVGYIIATADAWAFENWRNAVWYPPLREVYHREHWTNAPASERVQQIWADEPLAPDPELQAHYPAELHIDLLPRAQGKGLGRALTERLWTELRERGVPGVHLGVGARNTNAKQFYLHLGYSILTEQPWGTVMGKDLR